MADNKTVLIVDDEPDARATAADILSDLEGVATITAEDGESGLAAAREQHPDLIILDVQMPKRTGFDVFGELKRDDSTKDIPVVMLTGVAEKSGISYSAEDMEKYFGKEPDAYLEKPVDPEALLATASGILGI